MIFEDIGSDWIGLVWYGMVLAETENFENKQSYLRLAISASFLMASLIELVGMAVGWQAGRLGK